MKEGMNMIQLHDVSGKEFFLNCELIYRVDDQYDTIITLVDQRKLMVQETPEEVVEKVKEYKREIHANWRLD